MTNDEFEQLEFTYCDAIIKAEQVYRDTEGDLSRAIIAAILHENKALHLALDKVCDGLERALLAMEAAQYYVKKLPEQKEQLVEDTTFVEQAITAIAPYAEAIKKAKNHV